MVRTIDITAPLFLRQLIEPRQQVPSYGRTKGEIEGAVAAFASSRGGARRFGLSPLWGRLGMSLTALGFVIALAAVKPPYDSFALAAAMVLVAAGALLSNRTLFLPTGIASGRAPLKGRLAYYGGGVLLAVSFAIALAVILSAQKSTSWTPWLYFLAAMVASGLGAFLVQRGKRILQPSASELQAQDTRKPIVLLRSFADDDLLVVKGRSKQGLETTDFEESIENQFASFGPFIAIGKPGEALPTLGAARNYYSDEEWQQAVAKWMDEALLLVVIPGLTGGLGWELETIRRYGHLDKLLVLMPPRTVEADRPGTVSYKFNWSYSLDGRGWRREDVSAPKQQESHEQRWDRLRAAFAGIDAFADLPEDEPRGLIAMFLQDGDVVLLTGPEIAFERDYERAIRYAIYGMYCHGKTLEQGAVPLFGAPAPGLAKD